MKAVICKEYGDYHDLAFEEMDDPTPGPGQVCIDVRAAGLNFPDLLLVQGLYQMKPPTPFVPGAECAGVISALGEGVKRFAVGDRVIAYTMNGAFAQKVVVAEQALARLPEGMDFDVGAGITTTYATSYYALKQRADLQPSESLAVLGAAGGVGLAAVELGAAMGATVIACASTQEKLNLTATHGATSLINYEKDELKAALKEATGGKGADVIYDPVGGKYAEPALRAIGWNGRYLVIGFAAGDIPKIPLNLVLLKTASIVGVFWGAWAMRDPKAHAQNMAEIFDFYKQGKIKATVTKRYEMQDFMGGFDALAKREAKGKLVLVSS
jgi:NADPH:quinone reductase